MNTPNYWLGTTMRYRTNITAFSLVLTVLSGLAGWLCADEGGELGEPEASVLEIVPEAEIAAEGEIVEFEEYDMYGDECLEVAQPCVAYPTGGRVWARADYLLWWTKGMDIPPLVTGGPTGILGDQNTTILYGGEPILDDVRSGVRVTLGGWLDCNRCYGIEGDYWYLGQKDTSFLAASNASGRPALYRPFYNVNPRNDDGSFDPPARADAELVSSPDALQGAVQVDAFSELSGAGIRFRRRLCCDTSCVSYCDSCCRQHFVPRSTRLDFLIGYRYLRLREGLSVRETLTSLLPIPDEGSFGIVDTFDTANNFNGVDLGVMWERSWGRWSLELLGKLALGNIEQVVKINGQTTIANSLTSNGEYVGGLLAQRTNIGEYHRDVFGVLPELGLTFAYQVTCNWRLSAGYSLLYLSRVVRPGEQIDLDVNPDLLPPEFSPFAGLERPAFAFRDTDFWAQGLNFGLQCRW
jgi:hypothetical protein